MQAEQELIYKLALKEADGIGGVLFRHLISYMGSAEEVFKAPKAKLLKIPGFGPQCIQSIQDQKKLIAIGEKNFELCRKNKVNIIAFSDDAYPKKLKNLYDCPPIIFTKGKGELDATRSVGIVGTRKATNYGKDITEAIVEGLAPYRATIVSGLAYGIDIAAHKAALKHDLPTTAVMAGGIGMVYPAAHRKYTEDIMNTGLLISENKYDLVPVAPQFVARNRIIAGLSDIIIVVESAKRGGGLITAEYGNNYHREVFAVPGDVGNPMSEGPNNLIKDNKARIFTTVEDLVDSVSWQLGKVDSLKPDLITMDLSSFSEDESKVLTLLRQKGAYQIDEISFETNIRLNKLASLLLSLEFMDLVRALPGKKFELK